VSDKSRLSLRLGHHNRSQTMAATKESKQNKMNVGYYFNLAYLDGQFLLSFVLLKNGDDFL